MARKQNGNLLVTVFIFSLPERAGVRASGLRRYLVNLTAARPHAVRGEQVKQPGHKRIIDVITFDNAFFP